VEFAPQYWIWQHDGFKPEHGPSRLAGFLAHLLQTFNSEAPTIPDTTALIERIESLVPGCRERDRPAMAVLHQLYHYFTRGGGAETEKFLNENASSLEACGIETLAVWPLLHIDNCEWPIDRCVAVLEEYFKRRHRQHALNLPHAFEIAIMTQIANRFLVTSDLESYPTHSSEPSRNWRCACGSGLTYKRCCGDQSDQGRIAAASAPSAFSGLPSDRAA
jgi:hypothetical protein